MRYKWNYQAPTHEQTEAANSFEKEELHLFLKPESSFIRN